MREDGLWVTVRPVMRRGAGAVVLAAAVVGLGAIGAGGGSAHIGCPGKDIRFKAADGTRLVAHRYGKGTKFVVLAHQANGNLCEWSEVSSRLASLGYSALAFDFRGYGEAQQRTGAAERRFDRDVVAAIGLARKLGAKKVFVVGASMGGWAVVVGAAAVRPPVAGVVTLSAEPQFAGDATPAAGTLTAPILYLVSQDEGLAEETQALYEATGSADKTLKVVPGSAHGVALLSPILNRSGWRGVRALLESFLRSH